MRRHALAISAILPHRQQAIDQCYASGEYDLPGGGNLCKYVGPALLKVNLLASRGDGLHLDTLDLYSARQRMVLVKQAAIEMSVKEDAVKHDGCRWPDPGFGNSVSARSSSSARERLPGLSRLLVTAEP
jgi:hypothetical protein